MQEDVAFHCSRSVCRWRTEGGHLPRTCDCPRVNICNNWIRGDVLFSNINCVKSKDRKPDSYVCQITCFEQMRISAVNAWPTDPGRTARNTTSGAPFTCAGALRVSGRILLEFYSVFGVSLSCWTHISQWPRKFDSVEIIQVERR
jgi:hypothetical protein